MSSRAFKAPGGGHGGHAVRTIDQRVRIFGSEVYITVRDSESARDLETNPVTFKPAHGARAAHGAPPRRPRGLAHDDPGRAAQKPKPRLPTRHLSETSKLRKPSVLTRHGCDNGCDHGLRCSFQVPSPRHSVGIQPNAVWLTCERWYGWDSRLDGHSVPSAAGTRALRRESAVSVQCRSSSAYGADGKLNRSVPSLPAIHDRCKS